MFSVIDEMVTSLNDEQCEDDGKKAYCIKSSRQTEDEAKVLAHHVSGHRLQGSAVQHGRAYPARR